MKENIIVRYIPLPLSVRAFTLPDAQGNYNVYINCDLSAEQQRKSLEHEALHIANDDFYKDESAVSIEQKMKKLLEEV